MFEQWRNNETGAMVEAHEMPKPFRVIGKDKATGRPSIFQGAKGDFRVKLPNGHVVGWIAADFTSQHTKQGGGSSAASAKAPTKPPAKPAAVAVTPPAAEISSHSIV